MIKKLFFIIIVVVMAAACGNRKSGIVFDSATMPVQTVYDAKTMFTDRGCLQMLLEQPVLHNYEDEEKTQISPSGIEMSFYDKQTSKLEVYIRADSAVNSQSSKLMRFYRNVVIYDYRKGDTITTEALYWNQDKRKIYSDVYTRQAGLKSVTTGTGFDADEQLNNINIRNPQFELF
ncbi:MAG: LPS export ABC transporter periplasmic protein LptC [Bacteroidales bacterium]|jgi:LPS export ABC transporter protein LptC|nr:LPS export ABC transporter periplasmic protein LptC [Bacteroidales bacterium]